MSQHPHHEESVMPNPEAIDTPAEILAERFARKGMTLPLAKMLIDTFGPEAFEGANGHRSIASLDVSDGWRLTAFRIWGAARPRLAVGAFLMAVGWHPPGIRSQREMARMFSVSVEHISNEVEEWQRVLGLPRTEFQKSPKAVAAAKTHNRKNRKHHARKK